MIDKGSVSGCYINGIRLLKNEEKSLNNNDVLKFGNYPIEYVFEINDLNESKQSIFTDMKI